VVAGGGVVTGPVVPVPGLVGVKELPPVPPREPEPPEPLDVPELVLEANPVLALPLPSQAASVSAPNAIIPTKTIRTDPNPRLALVMQPPNCATPKNHRSLGAKSSTWELRVRVQTCDLHSVTRGRVRLPGNSAVMGSRR
jgi:hypothetical protein